MSFCAGWGNSCGIAFQFWKLSSSVLSMNMRTVSGSRPTLSNHRSATRVDEQLAFIERVCELLIESRWMKGHSYSPLSRFVATAGREDVLPCSTGRKDAGLFTLQDLVTDFDIDSACEHKFIPPKAIWPVELRDGRSASAMSHPGIASQAADIGTPSLLVDSAKPRGSPAFW